MFDALNVSATGLTAERLRMDVTAENALEHQAAVQVAHARIGILRSAMGVGG